MTQDQDLAMANLQVRLERLAGMTGATNGQVRAAMLLAITEGASRAKIEDMAEAVGLHGHKA